MGGPFTLRLTVFDLEQNEHAASRERFLEVCKQRFGVESSYVRHILHARPFVRSLDADRTAREPTRRPERETNWTRCPDDALRDISQQCLLEVI